MLPSATQVQPSKSRDAKFCTAVHAGPTSVLFHATSRRCAPLRGVQEWRRTVERLVLGRLTDVQEEDLEVDTSLVFRFRDPRCFQDAWVSCKRKERWTEGVPLLNASLAENQRRADQRTGVVTVASISPGSRPRKVLTDLREHCLARDTISCVGEVDGHWDLVGVNAESLAPLSSGVYHRLTSCLRLNRILHRFQDGCNGGSNELNGDLAAWSATRLANCYWPKGSVGCP